MTKWLRSLASMLASLFKYLALNIVSISLKLVKAKASLSAYIIELLS